MNKTDETFSGPFRTMDGNIIEMTLIPKKDVIQVIPTKPEFRKFTSVYLEDGETKDKFTLPKGIL